MTEQKSEQLWADVAVKMGQWKQTGRDAGPHDTAPFVDEIIALVAAADTSGDGLDALLGSVHPGCGVHVWLESEPEPENGITGAHYMAALYINGDTTVFGDGTTRMAAIADAVAAANSDRAGEGLGDE